MFAITFFSGDSTKVVFPKDVLTHQTLLAAENGSNVDSTEEVGGRKDIPQTNYNTTLFRAVKQAAKSAKLNLLI